MTSTEAPPPSRLRRFLQNFALLCIGLILALAMLEIALRIHNPFPSRLRGSSIRLPVNFRYEIRNDRIRSLDPLIVHTKNSLGFRGPEPPAPGERRLRIFTVGGSTTECSLIGDGNTWPELLGNHLRRSVPTLWLNNAGLDGHSTIGHMALLQQKLLALRPDAVLFLVGVNDLGRSGANQSDERFAGTTSGSWSALSAKNLALAVAERSETLSLIANLIRAQKARSANLPHEEVILRNLSHVEGPSSSQTEKERLRHAPFLAGYRQRLISLLDICRQHSVEPVLITQPALEGEGSDPVTGVDLGSVRMGELNGRMQWMILEWYNDVAREVGKSKGVAVIDLARTMPKSSSYFYDWNHYTNAGSAKVAEILAPEVLAWVAKRWPDRVVTPGDSR